MKDDGGKPIEVRNVTEVQVHSESKHFDLTLAIDPPALVSTKPIYAVTNSRVGLERIYQQLEITMTWNVEIEPDSQCRHLRSAAPQSGQMVEPEVTRPTARRRKATTPTGETPARPRR